MTNKLKYFIGNWKMFGDLGSIKIIFRISRFLHTFKKRNKVVLCVPSTLINHFTKKIKSKNVSIGAQNCHQNKNYGAFTGSVNARMLKNAGAKYIILGHSENRLEGDTNFIIRKKIESVMKEKMNIIFCIGETIKQKNKGRTFLVLRNQIKGSLKKKFNLKNIIIAYEPIWSIGTGNIPRQVDLIKIFKFIKYECKKIFRTKSFPKVLYGGSVNEKNIRMFTSNSYIDGFLIGGSSQSSKKFIDIIKNYYK